VNESGVLDCRWGSTIGQKVAAVLETLCTKPLSNSNQCRYHKHMLNIFKRSKCIVSFGVSKHMNSAVIQDIF
jgi:hypothetical protein